MYRIYAECVYVMYDTIRCQMKHFLLIINNIILSEIFSFSLLQLEIFLIYIISFNLMIMV